MRRLPLLLALFSIPFNALGEEGGIVLAGGAGSAYDGLGLHLELGAESFAVFAGTGLLVLQRLGRQVEDHHDLVLGMRYYSGNLDRFFLSTQTILAIPSDRPTGAGSSSRSVFKSAGVTAGWRWRVGDSMLELGGGAVLLVLRSGPSWLVWLGPGPVALLPDISLAYGWRF
jgi:hypothetical protein